MVKVGIVGYGNIGRKHQDAISMLDDIELLGICDSQFEGDQLSDKQFNSFEKMMLHHSDIDLISVCTPNYLHEKFGLEALNSGRHLICEKPFALSSSACQNIIDASKKNNKKIFCVMQNRFSPISQWLKKIIDSNVLGEIYMINVACYWNRNKDYYKNSDWRGTQSKDGGTLLTQFSHYVDTLYWLFGNLNIDHAEFRNFNHEEMIEFEDSCIFNFTCNENTIGSFSYSTSAFEKNFESTMSIVAEKGTIKIAGQYMDRLEYCNIQNMNLPKLSNANNIANLSKVYDNAIASIKNDTPIMISSEDGLNVLKIIEQVYSYKKS